MTESVYIDTSIHQENMAAAFELAIQSQAKVIFFIGSAPDYENKAREKGREVAVLPNVGLLPDSAKPVPFFPGNPRSRTFIEAQKFIAQRKSNKLS